MGTLQTTHLRCGVVDAVAHDDGELSGAMHWDGVFSSATPIP